MSPSKAKTQEHYQIILDSIADGVFTMNDPVASHGVSTNDNPYLNAAICGEFNLDDFAMFVEF